MSQIIDFHAHVFPDAMGKVAKHIGVGPLAPYVSEASIQFLKKQARFWLKPITHTLHQTQTVLRHLPEATRRGVDELSGLAPLANLLIESSPHDLIDAMDANRVDRAVIIAQPPFSPNEFVLKLLHEYPERFIVAVNLSRTITEKMTPEKSAESLKKYAENGAKILKIHASADGEKIDCERYEALLETAAELNLPVIIHTGCIHSSLLYRSPKNGQAENYIPWFKKYKKTRFVLAHMNYHDPGVAIDLAEQFENLYLDTSWQPSEIIGEAVRRMGADRILFATDWPIVGDNLEVGLSRIQDAVDTGLLSESDAEKILGANARILLGESPL